MAYVALRLGPPGLALAGQTRQKEVKSLLPFGAEQEGGERKEAEWSVAWVLKFLLEQKEEEKFSLSLFPRP